MKSVLASNQASIVVELEFQGGFKKEQFEIAPQAHGIYVAFACKELEDHFECVRIVYIGKAANSDSIRSRIDDHAKDRDVADSGKQSYWESQYCDEDEVIVYCYSEYDDNLEDIEATLIRRNQPEANVQGKDRYIGHATHVYVKCTGQRGLLAEVNSIMKLIRGSR